MTEEPLEYTCQLCGGEFQSNSDWSDDDAKAEWEKNFPDDKWEDRAIVCDDCYKPIMTNVNKLRAEHA